MANPLLYDYGVPYMSLNEPVARLCEKCAQEITADGVRCPDCEMDFHDSCHWSADHELCLDCLLSRYHRMDMALRRLKRDLATEIVAELEQAARRAW